jgi:NhaP-type Na+/H+ and K+/H+ antiporter
MYLRRRAITGWVGIRGAVSLAAALAVPATGADGTAVDDRDVVLLVTFTVIALIRGCRCWRCCAGRGCPGTPPRPTSVGDAPVTRP